MSHMDRMWHVVSVADPRFCDLAVRDPRVRRALLCLILASRRRLPRSLPPEVWILIWQQISDGPSMVLLTGTHDGQCQVWTPFDGTRCIGGLSKGSYISTSCLSHDVSVLATCTLQSVLLWDTRDNRLIWKFILDYGMISCCCFSGDNTQFAVVTHCSSFFVWDITSGRLLHSCPRHRYYATRVFAFAADRLHLLTVEELGFREEWDVATGRSRTIAARSRPVEYCQFSRDTSRVAISYSNGNEIYVFDAYAAIAMFIVNAAPDFFALSPTGTKIAFRCPIRGGIVINDFGQGHMYLDVQGYRFASLWGTKMAVGFTDCVVIYDIYT